MFNERASCCLTRFGAKCFPPIDSSGYISISLSLFLLYIYIYIYFFFFFLSVSLSLPLSLPLSVSLPLSLYLSISLSLSLFCQESLKLSDMATANRTKAADAFAEKRSRAPWLLLGEPMHMSMRQRCARTIPGGLHTDKKCPPERSPAESLALRL